MQRQENAAEVTRKYGKGYTVLFIEHIVKYSPTVGIEFLSYKHICLKDILIKIQCYFISNLSLVWEETMVQ